MPSPLPANVANLTEAQTMRAMAKLDALMVSRRLTPTEFKLLVNLELRMEQFVPEAELARVEEMAARQDAGEFKAADAALQEALARGQITPAVIVPGLVVREHGFRYAMPVILVGAFLAYNFLSKSKKKKSW